MKIIFMGSPAFAVPALEALTQANHEIVAVYSQPPRPAGRGQKLTPTAVHQRAEQLGIPVFTPPSLKSPEEQEKFAAHHADIAVVAAYGLILPKPILDAPARGCINIHPSLLPRWRGAAPIQRTLMAGDVLTGVCLMQMDIGLDTGDVLTRETFPIPDHFTAAELHDALSALGASLLIKTLTAPFTPVPQSMNGITYAQKITKEEAHINWSRSAAEIRAHIRGLSPAPGASFAYNGERIKILACELTPGSGAPGTVIDDTLTLACGSGAIRPLTLQRPGKTRQPLAEFLRGCPIPPGSIVS